MKGLIYRFLYLFLLLSLFLGCGSGSSSGNNVQKDLKIYGYVVDGYVANATVFIDTNLNHTPDTDEPQTKTSPNGYYELIINHIPVSDEIEVMAYGGEDIMFKTPLKGILKAQANYVNQNEIELNLTPLSTLAVAYRTINHDTISIKQSIEDINKYAKANNLLQDPVKIFTDDPTDLKQNIKLHHLMLSLTKLKYQNHERENVYETYKHLAKGVNIDKSIDSVNAYKINNKTLDISYLRQSIFDEVEKEIKAIGEDDRTISETLEDTSINPENYIIEDEPTPPPTPTPIPTPTPTPNTPPIANDLNISTFKNTNISSSLSASDLQNDTLTFILSSNANHGSLNLESNGSFTYNPNTNYVGSDSFTFKANDGNTNSNEANVSITIKATNTPPIANDLNLTTNEDIDITSMLNAKDDDNDTLTYIKVSNPSHGSVNIESNGSFTYEVGLNYHGTDSFTFKVNDGTVDSNEANVSITINSINDIPTANDFNITNTNTGKTINWKTLSSALDVEDTTNLTAELNTSNQPTKGSITITNENLTYTPNPNQNGNDTFKLNIKDTQNLSTTITIHVKDIDTIIPTITTPSIPNNHQVDTNLTITFSKDINISSYQTGYITLKENNTTNTNFTYNFINNKTLTINANLTYSKSYTLNIKNLKDNAGNTITPKEFTFTTQNFIPTANDFTISDVGTEKTVNWKILSNAQDSPNDTLSADLNTSPSYGSININANNLTYTPNANLDNNDTFKLNIKDTNGGVVVINVQTQGTDTIKPSIIFASSKPDINGTDFLVDENLTYNFSESIDISSATISLSPSIALTTSLTDANTTLNIEPNTNLAYNTPYTLTLSGIKDTAGNTMPPQSITFTTRSNIYFVSPTGSGNGSSWANADSSLQNAINTVSSQNNGQIWIKGGTYNISSTLTLRNKVYMYGGFSGSETQRSQRTGANETILDGGSTNRILSSSSVTDALIDGITFQNGKSASGGAISSVNSYYTIQKSNFKENTADYGGAICVTGNSASLTILDSNFTENRSVGSLTTKGGGSIYAFSMGSLVIKNSNFIKNSAKVGGSMYGIGISSANISSSNFIENSAILTAGSVYMKQSKVNLNALLFFKNKAMYSGAVGINNDSTLALSNSTFIQNQANIGGGIYILGKSKAMIVNSTFSENISNNLHGGGLVNNNSHINVLNSIFWNANKDISTTSGGTTNVNYSIVQHDNGFTNETNVISDNPLLSPQTQNGITYYYNLGVGSPAINTGDDTSITLTTDQIGNPRKNGTVDIGAIEMQ